MNRAGRDGGEAEIYRDVDSLRRDVHLPRIGSRPPPP
jgi:hypothetical protein